MDAALLTIDVQRGFDDPSWGRRCNPDAERNIAALVGGWRTAGLDVIHVRHNSPAPDGIFKQGAEAFEFKEEAKPIVGEAIVDKHVNSAFIGTGMEALLRARGHRTVVIVGFTTDHCCSTTARMAANLGFDVLFVADATATFARAFAGSMFDAETMHRTALASLNAEFAHVVNTEDVLARLSRGNRDLTGGETVRRA